MSSGYVGADVASENALIANENAAHAIQQLVEGPQLEDCQDCGEKINPLRVAALKKVNMRCMYCIQCQSEHDKPNQVRMLDRVL